VPCEMGPGVCGTVASGTQGTTPSNGMNEAEELEDVLIADTSRLADIEDW
jgi:hypothetical protein